MTIDSKLRLFRTIVRQNSKTFMDYIIETKVARNIPKPTTAKEEICIFCNSSKLITKEHVIPRWAFEKSTEKYFTTDVNGINQTYNKTTVPACAKCNNDWLGDVESYIIELFKNTNWTNVFFSNSEIQNIIRWLEIIEYKFHILE